jgi:hypothetical protein
VDHPERPVSWSLAFAVHTILTSIFETQESNHLKIIERISVFVFHNFFEQLGRLEIMELPTIPWGLPIVDENLKQMLFLEMLVEVPFHQTREQNGLSIWNPYCAGSFLSYIAYHVNLAGGAAVMDSVGRLRMTLHLFNALKQIQAIRPGQIESLDRISEAFIGCKSIWHGPLPVKSQFQACWSIAFETKPAARRHRAPSTRESRGKGTTPRERDRIDVAHLSKSFRRICLRDVSDVPSRMGKKLRKGLKHGVCQHVDVMLDTFSAMSEEQVLLATNLASLGFYMNEFYICLFNEWGWMPMVEQIVRDTTAKMKRDNRMDNDLQYPWEASDDFRKYLVMSHIFGEKVMAALDAGDTLVASRCADFMVEYFNDLDLGMLLWFSPIVAPES